MDRLERKLREDAEEVQVTVPPEISDRIMARVKDTPQRRDSAQRVHAPLRWWWASSLTGLAAAVTLLAVINWNVSSTNGPQLDTTVAHTVPRPAEIFDNPLPLQLQQAAVTTPLEQEMQNLESDLEKARDVVRGDLRIVF